MLNRLHTLPRETRDTLFLLAVIGWIILPQVSHLPLWCSALAATVLLWRGWLTVTQRPLPWRWLVLVLLLVTLAATQLTYRTLLGRDAGVALIVALLALKTLELRARRDAFVVFFLGFFTLLTQFFYSQSLPVALTMLLGLLGLLTALINSQRPLGRPPLRESAAMALRLVLLGAPLMLLLFLLFPRLAPLWGSPSDPLSGRSGLSASMRVGHIARLALDDSVALRLRFDGAQPLPQDLYFRGPVLGGFDGREWQPLRASFPVRLQARAELKVEGEPLRYEVTLEPNDRPWLFVLEATPRAPALADRQPHMSADLQWLVQPAVHESVRYRAESYPRFRHGPPRYQASLHDYQLLPDGFNPRTVALAGQLRREADTPAQVVEAALRRLRQGGYRYTLEPGVFGLHSADEFWFERKEGFCEHIASAFAILMRAADIPARIVTGYQGGERNAIDDFWIVRQSDAHAWVEVWLADAGWVRVDPTASVAPGRIGALQRLTPAPGVLANALGAVNPALLPRLRALWQAVNHRWNQWVLNYSQGRQLDLLRQLGFQSPSWEDLGALLLAGLGLLGLGGLAWAWWERRQLDPWLRLLAQARRRLATVWPGSVRGQAAPRALAQGLRQRPEVPTATAAAWEDWLLRLEALRYARQAPGRTGQALAQLRRELRQLPTR